MRVAWLLLGLVWGGFSWAEGDVAPSSSEPLSLSYESVFSGYKSYQDVELANWKTTNQQVMGGGHAGHQMPMKHEMPMPADNPKSEPAAPAGSDHQHMHH